MAKNFRSKNHPNGDEPEAFSDPKISEVHTQLAREKEEPREGFSGVPIFVVFLFCALGFWGSVYLVTQSGSPEQRDAEGNVLQLNRRFSGLAYETTSKKISTGPAEPKSLEKQIKDGEKLYMQNCASCHQANGEGAEGAFPPLAKSNWVKGSPERLIKIAHYGLKGEITVNGKPYNGAMTAIAESMNNQKLADLATYVRQAWGNTGEAVDVDTVKAIREATGKRGAWTGPELLSLHPLEP